MPEEQKPETESLPVETGYYKNTGSKVTDFLFGFLGYPIVAFFAQLAFGPSIYARGNSPAGWVTGLILLGLTAFAVAFSFHRGRKFIAIGILSVLLIPLLAFGSCLLVILAVSGK